MKFDKYQIHIDRHYWWILGIMHEHYTSLGLHSSQGWENVALIEKKHRKIFKKIGVGASRNHGICLEDTYHMHLHMKNASFPHNISKKTHTPTTKRDMEIFITCRLCFPIRLSLINGFTSEIIGRFWSHKLVNMGILCAFFFFFFLLSSQETQNLCLCEIITRKNKP